MRISDWSSDVCSSDLAHLGSGIVTPAHWREVYAELAGFADSVGTVDTIDIGGGLPIPYKPDAYPFDLAAWAAGLRSEEHTSELQSLMRISYAVFCLKKKTNSTKTTHRNT